MTWQPPTIGNRYIAVLGAGVLGRRIACTWVAAGYNVTIRDPSPDQRNAAVHFIDHNVATFAKTLGDKAVPGQYAAFEDLDSAVKDAWLVIEAIPEKLDLKIATFGDLAKKAPRDCIFGSNSSSYKSRLMLDEMDDEAKRRTLNVHYTMPPGNRVVELMTSTHTYDGIFPFLVDKHREVGLVPAVARKESTGFIINRLWAAVKRETLTILAEEVSDPEQIDNLWMEMFGATAGPCSMMDSVGLDTVAFIEDNYIQERHLDGTNTVDWLRKNYVKQGRLGAKSGNGGLYPAGYTTKSATENASHHDNLAAPTLYVLDIGLGENITDNFLTAGSIYTASANGQNVKKIVDGLSAPDGVDISVSRGRIFWTNMGIPSENDGSVQSCNLDGSDIKTVVPPGACVGIAIDSKRGKFYWTQKGSSKSGQGKILRANITLPADSKPSTRTDIETLFENLPEPIDLEVDSENEFLYWTDRGEYPLGNSVNRAYVGSKPTDPSAAKFTILTRHLHEAIGLRLDKVNKHIYFTDLGGSLYRTDLEGGNKTVIYSGRAALTGLALTHIN
ncbi:hypothetical protein APSETT444_002088 [Aspergillus pseudonomiae]